MEASCAAAGTSVADSSAETAASSVMRGTSPKLMSAIVSSVSSLSPFAGSASMTTAGALPSDFGTTGLPGNACAYSNAPPSRTACADRTKGIGSGSAAGIAGDLADPVANHALCAFGEIKQIVARRALLRQPQVETLLDGPRAFADGLEADHATRALERMKRAPHGGQRGLIVARGTQHLELLADAVENVTRFLDENLAQFIVGRRFRHRHRRCRLRRLGRAQRRQQLLELGRVFAPVRFFQLLQQLRRPRRVLL